jgi:tripartite-type tricarboxylate transporter receptor subunit TctC
MLAVHPSVPANSVQELIALAKARPGKLSFSSAGVGTSVHIAAELFKSMAGIDVLHVPYKGGTPSVQALLGGEVSMTFETVPVLLPHVKAGKLKGLAVTSLQRSGVAPDLPQIAQALPGYQVTTWFALFAPAGTPARVVQKIHDDLVRALAPPPVRARLAELGIDTVAGSPAELAEQMAVETQRFAKVIKEAGITAE